MFGSSRNDLSGAEIAFCRLRDSDDDLPPAHSSRAIVVSRTMTRRDEWQKVLDSEVKRWSAMSCDQLVSELNEMQDYEVEFDSKKYQVEVELLENTEQYVQIVVAVDDGRLPAATSRLCHSIVRQKENLG